MTPYPLIDSIRIRIDDNVVTFPVALPAPAGSPAEVWSGSLQKKHPLNSRYLRHFHHIFATEAVSMAHLSPVVLLRAVIRVQFPRFGGKWRKPKLTNQYFPLEPLEAGIIYLSPNTACLLPTCFKKVILDRATQRISLHQFTVIRGGGYRALV